MGILTSSTLRVWTVWTLGRVLLIIVAVGVLRVPHTDVASDVKVIYQGWAEVLRTGTFPMDDVTWQYPPLAGLLILLPLWMPGSYFVMFLVLVGVFDAAALLLLLRAGRGSRAGAWLWAAAVPLIGPTVYCRFDLPVTTVAIAATLALPGRPRWAGVLAGLGAMLKVWPVLVLTGASPRRHAAWRAWAACAATCAAVCFAAAVTTHGAFSFLGFQGSRGIEIESLGALPFYYGSVAGVWHGRTAMHYGSLEFLGPHVRTAGLIMLGTTLLAFGFLLLWRWHNRVWTAATVADAALTAVLLFTVTSRVISPQYMIWVLGGAAVCLTVPRTRMRPVAWILVAAAPLTVLEFPLFWGELVRRSVLGTSLISARDLLLLAAAAVACVRLWRTNDDAELVRGPSAPPARPSATVP
ncbi:glycosyltransferase 87 family protein [Streptacidiphilus neutrinimicus]|uniref:glycosyltransferase 87 family protein n=1 Tax=Streptacidiphilus neutrinimicus TaxID=105420 RepID=UPI0005A64E8A|nr:glycosyltransferase 87 family protein [Streptacidiphilus neutrinimicus]